MKKYQQIWERENKIYNNPKIIRVLKSNILVLCDSKFVIRKRSLTNIKLKKGYDNFTGA